MKLAELGWAELGSILQGIGSIFGAVSVAVAAWFASRTYDGWRRQKLSERRIEQGERILTATYKARRALEYIRNPFSSADEIFNARHELDSANVLDGLRDDQVKRLCVAQVRHTRIKRMASEYEALDECLPMARALYGEDVEKALEKLYSQFTNVFVSADWYGRYNGSDEGHLAKLDADLHRGSQSRPNPMDILIEENVRLIEDKCLPDLRLTARLYLRDS